MNVDLGQLFKSIDSRITSNPSSTSRSLAQELDVTARTIEQAIREFGGVSFRKYRENRRLAHVLKILERKRESVVSGNYEHHRTEARIILPGATVSILLRGRTIHDSGVPNSCPLIDISKGGLAFLSDRPLKLGRRVSLILRCTEITNTLCLEGRVVHTVASDIAGYPYRVGVRFMPFEAKRGCNSPEILEVLTQLEKATAL
jgi:hypothetical protein